MSAATFWSWRADTSSTSRTWSGRSVSYTHLCEPYAKLMLRGGELNIEWNRDENLIYMTGPAVTVFDGELLL